jgi:hypothetical protein
MASRKRRRHKKWFQRRRSGESEQDGINRLYPARPSVPSEPGLAATVLDGHWKSLAPNRPIKPQPDSGVKARKKKRFQSHSQS